MRLLKDSALFRVAAVTYHYGLTPNMLTALGLCFGVTSGILFMHKTGLSVFVFLFLSVFCDVLDGTVARKFHMETKFGLIFDSVADRTSETAVVLGALYAGIVELPGVVTIIGSISSSCFAH